MEDCIREPRTKNHARVMRQQATRRGFMRSIASCMTALLLPARIRASGPLNLYVSPGGTDEPSCGLSFETAFATPGYAVAWCAANLDAALQPISILIETATYTINPVPGAVGIVSLFDVLGTQGSWTQSPILITGSVKGIPIDPLAFGPDNPGPLISGYDTAAICGVGLSTLWQIQCMQLQSTITDIEADRGSRINVRSVAHGSFADPYPSPAKYTAIYGGSIEALNDTGAIYVNNGGSNLWQAQKLGQIIGRGNAPLIGNNVTFANGCTLKDSTSTVAVPPSWPQ